jgi:hypothetical protein
MSFLNCCQVCNKSLKFWFDVYFFIINILSHHHDYFNHVSCDNDMFKMRFEPSLPYHIPMPVTFDHHLMCWLEISFAKDI